ncbi:MAG: hypothetical protein JJE09_14700 [Bacteroidia bacterium]|nr:hypothetical protein [Bacteroidia bacterium]
MESKQIEQLLEKYWNAETSLEEEQQLRDFFRSESIPEGMKETAELFRYFDHQKKVQLTEPSFDGNVVRKISANRPAAKSVKMYFNYARIAAGLVVVVAATYFVGQEVRKSYPAEVTDTYSDPKLAFEETKKAFMMLSKGFGKARQESQKIKLFNEAEQKIQGKQATKEEEITI